MNLINYGQFKVVYLQKIAELLDQRGYSIRPVVIGEGLSLEKATLDLGNQICHCIDLQEVYSDYCKNARSMFSIVKDTLACFREFGTEQREQVESIENVLACVTNYEKSKESCRVRAYHIWQWMTWQYILGLIMSCLSAVQWKVL